MAGPTRAEARASATAKLRLRGKPDFALLPVPSPALAMRDWNRRVAAWVAA